MARMEAEVTAAREEARKAQEDAHRRLEARLAEARAL